VKENVEIILAIDATSENTSVSLSNGQRILISKREDISEYGGKMLLGLINEVIEVSEIQVENIDIFAVVAGPGRFTGLRNSLATVKAFSISLNKPVVCVPTLYVIAHSAGTSSLTCSLIPAKREEVFVQRFCVNNDGEVEVLCEIEVVKLYRLLEDVRAIQTIKWAGKGAVIYSNEIIEFAKKIGRECKTSSKDTNNEVNFFYGWCIDSQNGILSESVVSVANQLLKMNKKFEASDVKAVYGR
jgi:tRNA threonylcarbamoyl adenosine modification protein YeaZ